MTRTANRRGLRRRIGPKFESLEGRVMMASDVVPMTVGINLNSVDYYSTPMFVDAMKSASDGWLVVQRNSLEYPFSISGVTQPPMDANGYPIGLGNLASQGYALSTAPFLHNNQNFPTGAYTLLFDGNGTVVVHQGGNNITTVDQSGGAGQSHSVNVVHSDLGIIVSIVRSDPTDYVRNIRLIMPGYQNTYQTQPFYPAYLDGLKSFNVLRFMDMMKTNGQTVENWSDRTTLDYRTQTAATGVSVEYMVQLANTLHKDMWVNMPALAQDDYVRGFADYTAQHLDPGLKIYVEYGNEDWNYGGGFYTGYQFVDNYAVAHNLTHDQATADLAKHDWDIWRQEFGSQANRVERVAADQVAVPSRVDDLISRLVATSDPTDQDHGFEIISGAPYFGPDSSGYGASTTVQNIVADGLAAARAAGPQLAQFLAVRTKWETTLGRDIPAIMYEGGWGLTATPSVPWYQAYLQAQTDPGMYQVTKAYLDSLNSAGVDGLIYYSYVTPASQYGEWGSLEYLGQPTSQTPKFNALQDYALAVPPTISDVAVTNRTATGATITWTTSEPSSSQVFYGAGTNYGLASVLDPKPVSLHTVRLTGLSLNAIYHYQVGSSRESGLATRSSDLTFSTDVTPPSLIIVAPTHIQATSVTLSWMTGELSYGRIDYATAGDVIRSVSDPSFSSNHSITLTGLAPGTTYSYTTFATDAAGNSSSSGSLSVQTSNSAVADPLSGAQLTSVGSTPTAGTPSVVAGQGRYVYVAGSTAPFNLQVFDIGGGGSPVLKSTVATGSTYPTAITVQGRYAYIVSIYNGGLLIYDISDPTRPQRVSATDVGYHPYGIAIQGHYAYITHYDSNTSNSVLSIYDVGNPIQPIRVGLAPISPLSQSVTVVGRYAYITGDGTPNFQIFDVADPTNPRAVGSAAVNGYYEKAIAIQGHYAFVAYSYGGGGLQVLDIADPTNPVAVAKLTTGSNPLSIQIDGYHLYLIGDTTQVINITDPRTPTLLGSYPTRGSGSSLTGRNLITINPIANSVGVSDLGGDGFESILSDSIHGRLFAIDAGGNHILVFATNDDGTPMGAPMYILGLDSSSASVSQTSIAKASGMTYDSGTRRLYVVDSGNNRVLVFDASKLASGMPAAFVLGQAGFTTSLGGSTQSSLSNPSSVAFDVTTKRLFVTDSGNNRVLVFDTTKLASGMSAFSVLGQTGFTMSSTVLTQSSLSSPTGLAFDSTTGRLYVADSGNNRVMVFDTTRLTVGMPAAFVLGQVDYTHNGRGTALNQLNTPSTLTLDTAGGRIFVDDRNNDRVLTFRLSSLANGVTASDVLGTTSTTPGFGGLPLVGVSGLSYDATGNRLLITVDGMLRVIAAPIQISNMSVKNPKPGVATISWNTDGTSDSQVDYGTTLGYGLTTPVVIESTRTHAITLTGLQSGVIYHFRIRSRDANGNLDVGTDLTFRMP